MQRRLSAADVNDICATYVTGTSIDELARSYGVNRTTIITHLDQHGVPRRRVARKMTDALVAEAAVEYLDGHSLATVANKFNVAIKTLRRSFATPMSPPGRAKDGPTELQGGRSPSSRGHAQREEGGPAAYPFCGRP